jgi:hypothetical protein
MDDLAPFFSENKEIVVAIIAGVFGVMAAYIKRGGKEKGEPGTPGGPKPGKWLLISFVSMIVGAGLLAAEHWKFNLDPAGDLNLANPGAILCLAGSMLLAVGAVWTCVNLVRLVKGSPVSAVSAVSAASADVAPAAPAKKVSGNSRRYS